MNLLGYKKQVWQFLINDDNSFAIRKLPVAEGGMVEKTGDEVKTGWPILHKLQSHFPGFGGLKSCQVQVCLERDIIFDPFNSLSDDEKPEKGQKLAKKWIQDIANMVRYRHQKKPATGKLYNRVVLFLGWTLIVEVLILGIKVALIYYGRMNGG